MGSHVVLVIALHSFKMGDNRRRRMFDLPCSYSHCSYS